MSAKNRVVALLPAVVSLLLVIGVLTVFSACGKKDDGTWMHCHDVQNMVAVCGVVMTVLFVICAFVTNKVFRLILNLAVLAAAIVAFLLPGTIMPMCMMNTMRCYTVMQPFVRIMSAVAALSALIGMISALRAKD